MSRERVCVVRGRVRERGRERESLQRDDKLQHASILKFRAPLATCHNSQLLSCPPGQRVRPAVPASRLAAYPIRLTAQNMSQYQTNKLRLANTPKATTNTATWGGTGEGEQYERGSVHRRAAYSAYKLYAVWLQPEISLSYGHDLPADAVIISVTNWYLICCEF